MGESELTLIYTFEKVLDDMAPKDGKIYYWFNKRNRQIIEESVLKKTFKIYEDSNKLFLPD